MSLILKCLFLFLACQALPLNSSTDELQEEEVDVTDRFSKDEMSVKMDQNDNDDSDYSLAQIDNEKSKVTYLTGDQINEMQAEQNANFDFSQNFYVNLNGACNLESITQLVAFLILTLLWSLQCKPLNC